MAYKSYCDNCGIEVKERKEFLNIAVKDYQGNMLMKDVCSWACVAVIATRKSHEDHLTQLYGQIDMNKITGRE